MEKGTKIESATKDVLKPICNDACVITVMLQSFETRLRVVDLTHLMDRSTALFRSES